MADSGTLVRIADVHKFYSRGNERIDVLKGVNLDIPKGDFLALMGPSGSGKTTLLNLMGGLDSRPAARSRSAASASTSCPAVEPVEVALAPHRLRLPALQPAAGAERRAQRRAAAAADEALEGGAAQAGASSR